MKTARVGMTITYTPDLPKGQTLADLTDEQLKRLIFKNCKNMTFGQFSKDMVIWHTSAGHIEEDNQEEDSISKCDRAVIAHMDREKASVILSHPQTLQALLMVFSQLITTPNAVADMVAGSQQDKEETEH